MHENFSSCADKKCFLKRVMANPIKLSKYTKTRTITSKVGISRSYISRIEKRAPEKLSVRFERVRMKCRLLKYKGGFAFYIENFG